VNTLAAPAVDESLARRLLRDQFPQWAELPLTPLHPGGSDHVIFRLGDDLSLRIPRGDWAADQAAKESVWLPRLAPRLPVAIPAPVATGSPALGCPWHWSVHRWLPGETVTGDVRHDTVGMAGELARFVLALHRVPSTLGGSADALERMRRPTLQSRDASTRKNITAVADVFDADALLRVWEAATAAHAWEDGNAPVWCHGDLHNGNLLVEDGRLSAVIDFGALGIGDPAIDLMVAFTLLSPPTRAVFRDVLGLDDATWARGRGWALTTGLSAYTAYAATRPLVAASTRRQITETLADHAAHTDTR
jgi:aminoglycoside phosphotransferase (APT) family kinase protein